ncbi:accessory gene regulator B [Evansella vedderi]|uniref:Accessory gene regulator B n=1 Tax=Evansella vedderi TaxID=38282 RepID=A0ABT9ZP30_9BACI|nr:accessory gene regulator B family protein [Evansella vedderi]MDQ0252993.1 accessory gene regulator B [Evansella vedderi]
MITHISHRIAVLLCHLSDRNQEVEYVRYGIEIMLGSFLKFVALLGLAYSFGFFQPMVWAIATFVIFRSITGGHHYSTYSRCLFAGVVIFLTISYLSTKLVNIFTGEFYLWILSFSIVYGIILAYFYAPSNHFYKKISVKQQNTLRKLSFFAIFFWGMVMYYFFANYGIQEWILASNLGFIAQLSSIHPLTYKMVDHIEKRLTRGTMT